MQTDTYTDAFHIAQDAYAGPIDVLLELIEKRKIFVNDIALAAVTDDFIVYIQSKGIHPETTASFLSVAATLLLIKARSLLPNIALTSEETESVTDLERRVILLALVHETSAWLGALYGKRICYEGVPRIEKAVFAPDPHLSVLGLGTCIDTILQKAPQRAIAVPEARVYKTISITEVIDTLHARIEAALSQGSLIRFNDIAVSSSDEDVKSKKVYTIVSFLGMLELVRRGFIQADQSESFDAITMSAVDPIVLPVQHMNDSIDHD